MTFVPTPEKIDRLQIKKDLEKFGRASRLKRYYANEPTPSFSEGPAFKVPSYWTPVETVFKLHKPEKCYPMRAMVSTIGTPPYGISQYLVELIQPTLNKSKYKKTNSSSFVNEAKDWFVNRDEVQVSYDIVNLSYQIIKYSMF